MRTLSALFAVGFALAVSAEQYRLKFSATVEGWLTGFVLKSTSVGKRIEAVLKDGKEHRALVQVKPTKFKDEADLCVIEEFELVNGD